MLVKNSDVDDGEPEVDTEVAAGVVSVLLVFVLKSSSVVSVLDIVMKVVVEG